MANADLEHIFVAPIQKIWIMRCVEVPRDVSEELRGAAGENVKHPPVHGFIEGLPFKSTLVPAGSRCFRLHVHSRIWRKLRIDAGATVEVTLMLDQAPRPAVLPADMAAALAQEPRAHAAFHALTLPLRRQLIGYLEQAKHASTREKRVKIMVQRMRERAARKRKKAQGKKSWKKPTAEKGSEQNSRLRPSGATKKPRRKK
jgi:hypothetical protein